MTSVRLPRCKQRDYHVIKSTYVTDRSWFYGDKLIGLRMNLFVLNAIGTISLDYDYLVCSNIDVHTSQKYRMVNRYFLLHCLFSKGYDFVHF